jgi:6-pyruvoyl-tetrahydropterin synthase
VDPETGFVVDLAALDALLDRVVEPLDQRDLNRVIPEVRDGSIQPSTESLARWFWSRLAPEIPGDARLERVRVAELPGLAAEYRGPGVE